MSIIQSRRHGVIKLERTEGGFQMIIDYGLLINANDVKKEGDFGENMVAFDGFWW